MVVLILRQKSENLQIPDLIEENCSPALVFLKNLWLLGTENRQKDETT